METETYADGLKRVLQVKKSATADGKDCMVSSGGAVYDEAGRVTMQGEPYKTRAGSYDDTMVNATKIEYDVRGRQTRVENPDGTTVKYAYSASGNKRITSVTDPRGKVRTSYSDRKGNIERIEEPDGQTTSYTYDGMGQILTVTDSKGNVTTCKYDKQGRRLETENPDTGKIMYTYDGAGNLIAKTTPNTDKKGYAINYVYDNSRLIAVTSREGEPVKYTYGKSNDDMNGAGRLVKTESGNCVDEYGYDWMGNVIRHKRTIKGLDGKKTEYNASYSYDYFGRMKTMKLPDGEIVTYGYNKGGQLSGVGSSKGNPYVSGIKYNVTGQRTQINYGNGTGTSYEYDERNHRLKRLETRNAKSILQTIEYEYDDTGNVTERESEMLGTDGRMKRAVHEYEYDSSGRLTEGSGKVEKTTAGILRPNIVSYKSKYSYDAIGNILTKTQAVNGGESSLSCNDTYTYGGKQPHAVTKAGAMVFTYDDNGNMIKRENTETKNTMTLVWDDENRLIKTTDSLHTTDYRYDANGERIIKKSELGETQYVSANYIVRNKAVISKHIFAGNQRVASTVSMKDNCGTVSEKNTMYFHPDHLGSSSYVTDKKGNFFEMIEYLPYGETLYDEAATVDKTEFRFTGHLKDDETGFYYCHARYYDPKIGKFLTPDDRIDGLFTSAGQNMYMYCHGNPINFNDPDGHITKEQNKANFGVDKEFVNDKESVDQLRQKAEARRAKYNDGKIMQSTNNCASYAVGKLKKSSNELFPDGIPKKNSMNTKFGYTPGMFSGKPLTPEESNKPEIIIERMKADAEILGATFKPIGMDDETEKGNHKIALFVDAKTSSGEIQKKGGLGFHFYYQDEDGSWSEKMSSGTATNMINGKRVSDPRKINNSTYETFGGFFEVGGFDNNEK